MDDDPNTDPSLWKRVSTSYVDTAGAKLAADAGARSSYARPTDRVSESGVSDTAQLGARTPVLFAATFTREGKCGWPATMRVPSSS